MSGGGQSLVCRWCGAQFPTYTRRRGQRPRQNYHRLRAHVEDRHPVEFEEIAEQNVELLEAVEEIEAEVWRSLELDAQQLLASEAPIARQAVPA